jgi:hypothetical protein
MISPIARIILRYLAGVLVMKGLVDADLGKVLAGDAEILGLIDVGLGLAVGAVAEGWYWLARKFGWAK